MAFVCIMAVVYFWWKVSLLYNQQIVLKFHIKLEESTTETYILLTELYGNKCLSSVWIFQGFKRILDSWEDIVDDLRSSHFCISKTDKNIE